MSFIELIIAQGVLIIGLLTSGHTQFNAHLHQRKNLYHNMLLTELESLQERCFMSVLNSHDRNSNFKLHLENAINRLNHLLPPHKLKFTQENNCYIINIESDYFKINYPIFI